MLMLWRVELLSPLRNQLRFYAKKPKLGMATKTNMVHQELLRYINPFACINIETDLFVRVEPADVHQYTSGDVFIAQLRGDVVKNCTSTMKVSTCEDNKVVNVLLKKPSTHPANFTCHLKVPIRADLYIKSNANVYVNGIQSEALHIKAANGIFTKNLRSTHISLFSENGNIICDGTLLGKSIEIETHNGNISLGKLQGDNLRCLTKTGNIQTDCCYVENSKFDTETGHMSLKNVHKISEIHVHKAGALNMTGVHGNLNVVSKGGTMNLQLSEVIDKSEIVAHNLDQEAIINISEAIEENVKIEIHAESVNLDPALSHVSHALSNDKSKFLLSNANQDQHHLRINSTGEKGVRLGKLSWTDMMRAKMNKTVVD